jgi:hypothetical protein
MRSAIALVLLASILGLTGCALMLGGAAGAGTVAYVKGELKEQLPATTEQIRDAIGGATAQLGLVTIKTEADKLSGDYVVRTGSDEKVMIRYERVKDNLTEVRIRVGMFGDENLSRSIMGEIKKRL